MQIRQATIADYHGADTVQQASLSCEHAYRYAENLKYPGTENLIAVKDGQTVGFISILINQPNPDGPRLWQRLRPYVGFVGVLPEFQGQKVGAKLIHTGANAVLNQTKTRLWLECSESTKGFYEALGFVCVAPETVQQTYGLMPKGFVYCLDRGSVALS